MAGYVYLIGSPTFCWYKIGRSTTPEIRIKSLGVLLPFKIHVIAIWKAEGYKHLESLLHKRYRKFQINGEWFRFSKTEVQAIILDVPYTMIQLQSLVNFENVEDDFPSKQRPQMTREEGIWQSEHKLAWQQVSKIEPKEERKKAMEKLIADRKAHKILVMQKRMLA
jgi:Meiotically up-regulated gene 113